MELVELENLVGELELRIERLRSLYDQYFMGIEKLEPGVPRKDVERRIQILRKEQIRNTGLRFRFQMILQRFNTYQSFWLRICREIENGTYKRHMMKAQARFGDEARTSTRRKSVAPPKPEAPVRETLPPPSINDAAILEDDDFAAFAALEEPRPMRAQGSSPKRPLTVALDFGELDDPLERDPSSLRNPVARPATPRPPAPPQRSAAPPLPSRTVPAAPPAASFAPRTVPAAPPAPRTVPAAAPTDLLAPGERESSLPGVAGGRIWRKANPEQPRLTGSPGAGPPGARRPPTGSHAVLPPAAAAPPARSLPPPLQPPRPAAPAAPPRAAVRPEAPSSHATSAAPVAASPPPRAPAPPVAPRPPPPARPAAGPNDLPDERVRQLYAQYVETKRRHNESTAAITYDNLAKSLRESGAKLREKHGRAVDFEVAVKDGKTVIKPVVK